MNRKYLILLIILALFLGSLACRSQVEANSRAQTQAVATMQGTLTSIASTLEAQETERAATTLSPDITPTPTCEMDVFGFCTDSLIPTAIDIDSLMGRTPTPTFSEPQVLFWGKVIGNKSIPIYDNPGENSSEVGKLFPEEKWPVNESVSGWIRPQGIDGHYFGFYLTCWLENIDISEDLTNVEAIEHSWEHQNGEAITHAHCQSDKGTLIARLDTGVKIVKVVQVDYERSVYLVILEMLWVNNQNIKKN